MSTLQKTIETAYDSVEQLTPTNIKIAKEALEEVMQGLESGQLSVVEPQNQPNSSWKLNEWLKKAVLLYFRLHGSQPISGGFAQFYDKIPLRFGNGNSNNFEQLKTRIVPPATIRRGAYLGQNTVIMPSYINIGAYVDSGTMVDTWCTVGSCARIGKNVHLSGGVGIGGVLEPLQASPTIIEDNCFIGARSEIVEGVVVEQGAVISMGVYIGQSTKIYNRETGSITYGRVPRGSVVVPGNLPSEDGKYSLYCAVIVKQVDDKTRAKTAINELLRI